MSPMIAAAMIFIWLPVSDRAWSRRANMELSSGGGLLATRPACLIRAMHLRHARGFAGRGQDPAGGWFGSVPNRRGRANCFLPHLLT